MSATESTHHELVSEPGRSPRASCGVLPQRTAGSQKATERARKVLPLGVPSSFQAYDPHPIVVRRAQASWMEDVDGNRYIDFDMGFGALFAGHMPPGRCGGDREQLDDGTLFVTPCEMQRRRRRAARRALRAADVALHQLAAPRRRWTRSASLVASPAGTRS